MKRKRTPSTLLSEVKLFSIFQQSGNFRLKRREHWVRLKSHSNPSEPEILLKSHFSLILNSHRILSVLQVHRYSPSIFASLTFFKTLKSRLRSVRLWGIWWGRIRWRSPRLWSWWGSGLSRYKVCMIQICWYVWYKYVDLKMLWQFWHSKNSKQDYIMIELVWGFLSRVKGHGPENGSC